jgi:broad specificity phosphatase PhoE
MSKVTCSYVSPRTRAQRTLELLNLGCKARYPWSGPDAPACAPLDIRTSASIQITPAVREWDYGSYEGKTSPQIRQERKDKGEREDWDIWRDGCEDGETPEDVEQRLDELIAEIREKFHKDKFGKDAGWKGKESVPNDVLICGKVDWQARE